MRMRILLLALTVVFIQACNGLFDLGDVHINMDNRSNNSIACYVLDVVNTGKSYPDTILTYPLNSFCLTENITEKTEIYGARSGSYAHLISDSTQNGILSIYVFAQEDIDKNGWESVLSNNRYLVRYDLTAMDLEVLAGEIVFPPTEEMKSVHMWPLYK